MLRHTLVLMLGLGMSSMAYGQDICALAAQERAKVAGPLSPSQAVTVLNSVAASQWPQIALLQAPAGGNGGAHASGKRVRLDRLVRIADRMIFDMFTDGPDSRPGEPERSGNAGPSCGQDGTADVNDLVMPMLATGPGPSQPPSPPPAPPEPPAPPAPPPPIIIPAAPVDITPILQKLDTIIEELREPSWMKKVFSNPWVQSILAGTGTCLATQCWKTKEN